MIFVEQLFSYIGFHNYLIGTRQRKAKKHGLQENAGGTATG